jgi:hypothetical protein
MAGQQTHPFWIDDNGSIAPMAAIMIPVAAAAVALAVDLTYTVNTESAANYAAKIACDRGSIALAAGKAWGQAKGDAKEAFYANMNGFNAAADEAKFQLKRDGSVLIANANAEHKMFFAQLLGVGSASVRAEASCEAGGGKNGKFVFEEDWETPAITSDTGWDFTDIPRWKVIGPALPELQDIRTGGDAHHGKQFLELDSSENTAIQTEFELTQGKYEISFFYRSEFWNNPDAESHWVRLCLELSSAGMCTNKLDELTDAEEWIERKKTFTVKEAGTYRLSMHALGESEGHGGHIDWVRIRSLD